MNTTLSNTTTNNDDDIKKANVAVFEQETSDERKKTERKLLWKIDLLLLPPLFLMYLLNYLDRQNITSARLANIEEDLNLSETEYQTCVSILFVGYILMGVPSNMILSKIPRPAYYMCTCMCVWGFLSAGVVQNFAGLVVIRFFLGVIEAAFFPGALFYLSCWYTRKELASRTAILYMGSQMGNAWLGNLLAVGILELDGVHNISGWRWLFIVEGVATCGLAIIFAFILPDFPSSARRVFTEEDKQLAQLRLEEDSRQADTDNQGTEGETVSRRKGFMLVLADPKVWLVIATLYCDFIAASVVQFFPSVVATLGFSRNITFVCTAPPYLLCCILLLINGFHADKTKEHYWHVVIPLGFLALGNIIAVATTNTGARYFAMMLMPGPAYAASIVILAWLSHLASRPAVKRASALAFCNSVVNTPNIWCTYLYFNPPRYVVPFVVNTVATILGIVICTVLRMYLARQNKLIETGQFDKLGKSGPTKTQLEQGFKYML